MIRSTESSAAVTLYWHLRSASEFAPSRNSVLTPIVSIELRAKNRLLVANARLTVHQTHHDLALAYKVRDHPDPR